ncbi:MAG: hypothetical protein CMI24_03210 [Opitutae bacterium]|nr:hypothetical protein [Opitutae bacterium]
MSFLQPIALLGIALAATPILIHLLNLMRHRRESWAAMMFLIKAKENSSRMSKIRRWLTLLFRTLAICALSILLSRPMASDESSLINFSNQKPEVLMLVIDRSSSMQKKFLGSSKTLLRRGLEEFEQFSKSWPESKLVVIETVFSETVILDEIETLFSREMEDFFGPTDSGGNLPFTINKGLNWLEDAEIGHVQILVISDQQESNWKIRENEQLIRNIKDKIDSKEGLWKLRFLKLESAEINNFSLVCKTYREETDKFHPTLLITGNQKNTQSLAVKINVNGKLSNLKCRFFPPSTTWTPAISLSDQPPKGWIKISLPEDSFSKDNDYFFTYGNQEMLKVGIACKDEHTRKFITAVCNLDPERIFLNETFSLKSKKLKENDLLMIQGFSSPEEDSQILKFIKAGGRVVNFPDFDGNNKPQTFQNWNAIESASKNDFFQISEWNRNQGIFANTANGRELALPYLKILQRKIPKEGETLAFYKDGESFFRRKTIGQGVVYSFSTLPNRDWSNLGEGFVLVPLLIRIFDESSESPALKLLECGESASLEYNELTPITGNPNQKPSVNAGIYKELGKFFAFNRKTSESQDEMLNQEEMKKTMSSNHILWSEARANSLSFERAEIWNLFLIIMLLFLLGEGLLGLPAANFSFGAKRQ